jgi:hypothetical protein
MITLNTVESRAMLDLFDGKVPNGAHLKTLAAIKQKLRNHEGLIAQCEASVSRPAPTEKEPA